METKGTQSNQIKRNLYDANYKLIVIQNVEKHAISKPQGNSILMNPVSVSYTHLDVYKRQLLIYTKLLFF